MKTFVTGATGFIGAAIVRQLLQVGREVRVLVRPSSSMVNLTGLDVEPWPGDLLDASSLRSGLQGCDVLYHVAADYRLWCRKPSEMFRTNVSGTRTIMSVARETGVGRIVYTSSVGTLGYRNDGHPADEDTPVTLADMAGVYKQSKYLAEREVEQCAAQGLPVVIVNPSTPVGAGDVKPTPTGKIIVDFLNGAMPAYLDTGLNLIDVDECARGHLLAEQYGRVGRKYILGGENFSLQDILAMLAALTGRTAPRIRLPYLPVLCAAWLNEGWSLLTGQEPRIPLAGVKMAARHMYFDSSRAVSELGLRPVPVEHALERAVGWFYEHGYVKI